MDKIFSEKTIDFLWDLSFNNNKLWFTENKHNYIEYLQDPMKALAHFVFTEINSSYPALGLRCKITRIYRDSRRVRDGRPYKENLWFVIEKPNEVASAALVFWFEIEKEVWSYGLGYWNVKPLTMAKLRARIDKNPNPLEKIEKELNNLGTFTLSGEEYKREKVSKSGKLQHWYNRKNIGILHQTPIGDELYQPDLKEKLITAYKQLMPLYQYLESLDYDPDPK